MSERRTPTTRPHRPPQDPAARQFCLRPLRPRPRGIVVVAAGFESRAAGDLIGRAPLPCYSVEFVTEGSGRLELAGETFVLGAGTIFSHGPTTAPRIRTRSRHPLPKYFVNFVGDAAAAVMAESGLTEGTVRPVTEIGEVRDAFETLLRLGARPCEHASRMCELQLRLLLYTIARSPRVVSPDERRARSTFERCRQIIDAGFLRFDSVDDIVAACHIDPSHLCRLFRRFHDESPLRYLQRLRMRWAAERLQQTPQLVRDVARELMTDPYQFCRVFRRIHGVTPSEFILNRSGRTPPSVR